ncbi:unnamed protein product [Sphagnum troendelagicum]|uniref:Uncharacterized protein n=1 Tax=Sphagnum troendelagicum TaxID=128251 RepID=A0ABP0UG78_9BRYO
MSHQWSDGGLGTIMLACALFYLAFKVGELGQRFAVIGEQIANTCDRVADVGERVATTAEQMADAAETAYISEFRNRRNPKAPKETGDGTKMTRIE